MVPYPFMVAVVEALVELANVMLIVLEFQLLKVWLPVGVAVIESTVPALTHSDDGATDP
jgi:hypothetical protein